MNVPLEILTEEAFYTLVRELLAREYPDSAGLQLLEPKGFPFRQLPWSSASPPGRDGDLYLFVAHMARSNTAANLVPEEWSAATKRILDEKRRPTRVFVVTNLRRKGNTGWERLQRKALLELGTLPIVFWWRDDIELRVAQVPELLWRYPQLISAPELIRVVVEARITEDQERRTASLRAYLTDQYNRDAEVKFKQIELQNKLLELFIDVPVSVPEDAAELRRHPLVQRAMMEVANETAAAERSNARPVNFLVEQEADEDEYVDDNYYRSRFFREFSLDQRLNIGGATLLLHAAGKPGLMRVVLEGAPGQGKSTIAQYICQVHRMHLLDRRADILELPLHHRNAPLRVPFKVDLRDLDSWLSRKNPFDPTASEPLAADMPASLEAFLAAKVRHYSGGAEFSVNDLLAVAKVSAILLVFDGLDEVADVDKRSAVVKEIDVGVSRLMGNALSLQAVVTSRPAAFATSPGMPPARFPHIRLASVTEELIAEYAHKWLLARSLQGSEAEDVRRILRVKLSQPHLRELARNPMQLAILLSLIHTRGASLPDKRTALYDSYVELFFNREAEKSAIIRSHRDLLINLHRYLAWVLHTGAQTESGNGSISGEHLDSLLRTYLKREGHDSSLVETLFTGMVERVVAIVSRLEGTFEFEVQPLREYFAARYLYETAPYSPPGAERRGTKPERFAAIARDPYWLNVTRFYAGCYSTGELASLADGIEELLDEEKFRDVLYARILAVMLLSDWVFTQKPRVVQRVARLLIEERNFEIILTGTTSSDEGGELSLPQGCGREELLEQALGALRTRPPIDKATALKIIVAANDGTALLRAMWEEEVLKTLGPARTNWLLWGYSLGLLLRVDSEKLTALMADSPLQPDRLRALVGAERTDGLDSEIELRSLVDAVLDGGYDDSSPRRWEAPVMRAFARIWGAFPYRYAVFSHHTGGLMDLTGIPGGGLRISTPPRTSHTTDLVLRTIENAREVWQIAARSWGETLVPWETLVESARQTWGERWVFYELANLSAAVGAPAPRAKVRSLNARSESLCQRAQLARKNAGMSGWWQAQLSDAEGDLELQANLLLLLTWASATCIVKLAPVLDALLGELSERHWNRIWASLSDAFYPLDLDERQPRLLTLDCRTLLTPISERLAAALALRSDDATGLSLLDECLIHTKSPDHNILATAQNLALLSLVVSPDAPAKRQLALLRVVERSYAQGILGSVRGPASWMTSRAEQLSAYAIKRIAANPGRFPLFMVAETERRARVRLGGVVTQVGAAATMAGWFESDPED